MLFGMKGFTTVVVDKLPWSTRILISDKPEGRLSVDSGGVEIHQRNSSGLVLRTAVGDKRRLSRSDDRSLSLYHDRDVFINHYSSEIVLRDHIADTSPPPLYKQYTRALGGVPQCIRKNILVVPPGICGFVFASLL